MRDQYPTHHDQYTDDDSSREKEYREKIVGEIVEASTGSVGIYTPLNLTYDERRTIPATIAERQHTANKGGITLPNDPDKIRSQADGWANYGDRQLGRTDKLWEYTTGTKSMGTTANFSALQLFDLPDGTVDIRYAYRWDGYNDQTNRGSTLWTSFVLPKDKADEFNALIKESPDLIDDVIQAQVLATGISEQQWKRYIQPRGNHKNRLPVTKKEMTLEVSRYTAEQGKYGLEVQQTEAPKNLSYADSQPVLPKTNEISPTEVVENDSAQDIYNFLDTSLKEEFEKDGVTKPDEKISRVVGIVNDYIDLRSPAEPGSPEEAQQQAYEAAYQQLITNYLQEDIENIPDWNDKSVADKVLHVAAIAATTHDIRRSDDEDGNDTTVQRMFEAGYEAIATNITTPIDDESLLASIQQPARDLAWNALQNGATENDIYIATSLPKRELDTSSPVYEELYKLRVLTNTVLKRKNSTVSRSLIAWTRF